MKRFRHKNETTFKKHFLYRVDTRTLKHNEICIMKIIKLIGYQVNKLVLQLERSFNVRSGTMILTSLKAK